MKKKRDVLCYGNEYIEGDDIAKKIGKDIKSNDFNFILTDSVSDVLNQSDEIIILDVAKGIKKVSLIEDISKLEIFKSLSCHDLDLGFYLKLLKETKKIKDVKIIAIPFGNNNIEELKIEVLNILNKI